MSTIDNWISEQASRNLASVCANFASHVNRADSSLAEVFAPDCRHESQTRFDAIEGREDVASYFLSWVDRPIPLAFAELATAPPGGEPCVLMSVRDSTYGRPGLGEVRSYITFQVNADGLIQGSFAVSLAPDPRACRRSGIYPGLSEEDLRREREWVGKQLPRSEGLELLLFVLPELESQADAYLSTVTDAARDLGLPSPRVEHIRPGDERVSRLGVVAHPTVVLALDGQRVRLLEGLHTPDESRERLSAALAIPEEDRRGGAHTGSEPQPVDADLVDYFGPPSTEVEAVLRQIKGDYRRQMIRRAVAEDEFDGVPEAWLAHSLSFQLRDFLGSQFPGARGGEDLPDLLEGEVEIARLSLESVHCEVTSLRARGLGGGRLSLRMVGEDDDEVHVLPQVEFEHPLSSEDIVRLFFDAEPAPAETSCSFTLSSFFYPDLDETRRSLGLEPEES